MGKSTLRPMTESGDDGGTRVHPSSTSLDAVDLQVTWVVFGAIAVVGLWLALGTAAWILGLVLAAVGCSAVLHETWKWTRTRGLRKRLGEIVLTLQPYPARIGEALEVRLAQRVRSHLHVLSTIVRLQCSAARIETFGARDRERRVWSRVVDAEVVERRDLALEAGDVLTAAAEIELPGDQFPSSEWTSWTLLVEVEVEACPPYSATFPLEVISASRGRGS